MNWEMLLEKGAQWFGAIVLFVAGFWSMPWRRGSGSWRRLVKGSEVKRSRMRGGSHCDGFFVPVRSTPPPKPAAPRRVVYPMRVWREERVCARVVRDSAIWKDLPFEERMAVDETLAGDPFYDEDERRCFYRAVSRLSGDEWARVREVMGAERLQRICGEQGL